MATEPSDYDRFVFDLLVALRGGLPERCDFCGKPYNALRYPIPEEAGEWTCNECLARWEREKAE